MMIVADSSGLTQKRVQRPVEYRMGIMSAFQSNRTHGILNKCTALAMEQLGG